MIKKILKKIKSILKDNSLIRKGYAFLACLRYGFPNRKLKIFGITGTNGKTTTSYFLKSIFEANGFKTGLIGTSGYWLDTNTKIEPPAVGLKPVTTPDPFYLYYLLRQMVNKGTEVVVMEVSSFGLKDWRIFGIDFKGAILTNISLCHHILQHNGFKNYLESKKRLFKILKKDSLAILPIESEYFNEFKKVTKGKVISYGFSSSADVSASIIKDDEKETLFKVKTKEKEFDIRLSSNTGYYNVLNALSAISLALNLNISYDIIKKGIENCPPIEGRFEVFEKNGIKVIVDKANTPAAFLQIIKKVKNLNPKKIIGVYGNFFEFPLKIRQELAEIAIKNFDLTIITADDSNNHSVKEGIDDFLNYVVSKTEPEKYLAIEDRKLAIKEAIEKATKGDVILVLGRGDEKLMNLEGKIIEFDDREVVKEALKL